MWSTLYLHSSPEASGPAPATHRSQLPGLDGPSTTPPSSGSSCKGNGHLEVSASPSTCQTLGKGQKWLRAGQAEVLLRCSPDLVPGLPLRLPLLVDVAVNGQVGICVVGRVVVGHHPAGDSQAPHDCREQGRVRRGPRFAALPSHRAPGLNNSLPFACERGAWGLIPRRSQFLHPQHTGKLAGWNLALTA